MDIKKLREIKKLTQTDIAVKVGVSLVSVRMWELGVTQPNEENLKKLMKVLGVKE